MRIIKWSLFSSLVFLIGVGLYFWYSFNMTYENCSKLYYYTIKSVPFKKKTARYISFVSSNNKTENIYFEKVKMKARGGSSADFPKHNFTIEFPNKISIAGMPKDDDWILCASYIDRSFLRNKVSFDLFMQFHENNIAPQTDFLEVYRNLRYHGLYVAMERMDAKRLKVDKSDQAARVFKEPSVFIHPSINTTGSNPDKSGDLHHQKFPKFENQNFTSEMEQIRNFIVNSPDSVFYCSRKGVANYFDLDNIIDWHILLLLTHNEDGLIKNFVLYKQNENSKYKIAPWDYDHSFGRDGDSEPHEPGIIDVSRNTLFARLLTNEEYKYSLKKRYRELVTNGILCKENIYENIDSISNNIHLLVEKNNNRWTHDDVFFDEVNFPQEIEFIKSWIPKQLSLLDNYFNNILL